MTANRKWQWCLVLLAALSPPTLGGSDTVFERNGDDGSLELTNIRADGSDYRAVAAPAKRTAATPLTAAASPATADSHSDAGPLPMRERLRALYDAARAARQAAMDRNH